jgi:hypothetical protein
MKRGVENLKLFYGSQIIAPAAGPAEAYQTNRIYKSASGDRFAMIPSSATIEGPQA